MNDCKTGEICPIGPYRNKCINCYLVNNDPAGIHYELKCEDCDGKGEKTIYGTYGVTDPNAGFSMDGSLSDCGDGNTPTIIEYENEALTATCPIVGCMDSNSPNYDATATVDSNGCINIVKSPPSTPVASDGSITITMGDGTGSWSNIENSTTGESVQGPAVLVSTGLSAGTYDFYVDPIDIGFQVVLEAAAVSGCTDPTADNYDPAATVDNGFCIYSQPATVYGCTDQNAINYDPAATVDDGLCIVEVLGCTDPTADNYDPTATIDDGTCIIPAPWELLVSSERPTSPNGSDGKITVTIVGGTGTYEYSINGSSFQQSNEFTGLVAGSYPVEAQDDNGIIKTMQVVVEDPVLGCMDSSATNFLASATVDDGSCINDVYGCMDSSATNFLASATVDDGSCIYDVSGCMDSNAISFVAIATVDDGSCIYDDDQYVGFSVSLDITPPTSTGGANGKIVINVTENEGDMRFKFSEMESTYDKTITNISAGTYDLEIVDEGNGETLVMEVTVPEYTATTIVVEQAADTVVVVTEQVEEEEPYKMPTWLIITIVVVVVLLLGVGIFNMIKKPQPSNISTINSLTSNFGAQSSI